VQQVVIIGAGGGSRDLLDIFEACNQVQMTYEILGFIVEAQYATPGTLVNDKPVLGGFDWLGAHRTSVLAICGVGAPNARARLVRQAEVTGISFCSIVHPTAIVTPRVQIGAGTSIGAGCILTNQIQIANHVYVNIGCTISHDCILEDYVTLCPGVHIAGNVTVAEGCFIGMAATIIEQKHIGPWAIVGAGSTIIHDVPPHCTVAGVAAKIIPSKRR
jgi:sugar O-acyltransferase (sialic acid O-acetyltransferase NeuD family)